MPEVRAKPSYTLRHSSGIPYGEDPASRADKAPQHMSLVERSLWWDAARRGEVHHIDDLISKAMPVNLRDGAGLTCLYFAAMYDQLETVKFLISKGADVNLRGYVGYHGDSALHKAAGNGSDAMVALLLEAGADPMAEDGSGGRTPRIVAIAEGKLETALSEKATVQEKLDKLSATTALKIKLAVAETKMKCAAA